MNKERIDDLVDILGDEYAKIENTFVIKNNQQLAKYLDNPVAWKTEQLKNRGEYKGSLVFEAKEQLKNLNNKAEKVFLLSYKEIAKDQIKITEHEIIAENIPKSVRKEIKAMKKFNKSQILRLANQTLKTYTKQVRIVDALSTPDTLYDSVKQQMKLGIDKGIKIPYKDGRMMTWKSYMEMNIRTTIHQEMSKEQVNAGASVGQVFYISDSFADCAKDHHELQGKIFYNAKTRIPKEIMDYIKQHNIMSMQEAMGEPYWLTTRPNCRHNFHAIPLDEAMGMSAKKILDKYNFSTGKYEGSNYEKRMKQRYNERMIRKYKLRMENQKEVNKSVGQKGWLNQEPSRKKINEWQAKQRKLISENPKLLQRDYDRENIKVVTQDLGVRYDYTFKNGEIKEK